MQALKNIPQNLKSGTQNPQPWNQLVKLSFPETNPQIRFRSNFGQKLRHHLQNKKSPPQIWHKIRISRSTRKCSLEVSFSDHYAKHVKAPCSRISFSWPPWWKECLKFTGLVVTPGKETIRLNQIIYLKCVTNDVIILRLQWMWWLYMFVLLARIFFNIEFKLKLL